MSGLAHLGFGFAAKKIKPGINVIILLVLSVWLDLVWFISARIGISDELGGYLSHSMVMALAWSAAGFLITLLIKKRPIPAAVVAAVIFSHYVMDVIAWPMTAIMPEAGKMPIFFAPEPAIGLGLYRTLPGAIIGEIGILGAGVVIYILSRKRSS